MFKNHVTHTHCSRNKSYESFDNTNNTNFKMYRISPPINPVFWLEPFLSSQQLLFQQLPLKEQIFLGGLRLLIKTTT